MAFCTNCGNELKDGMQFCGSCGTKIENIEKIETESVINQLENESVFIHSADSSESVHFDKEHEIHQQAVHANDTQHISEAALVYSRQDENEQIVPTMTFEPQSMVDQATIDPPVTEPMQLSEPVNIVSQQVTQPTQLTYQQPTEYEYRQPELQNHQMQAQPQVELYTAKQKKKFPVLVVIIPLIIFLIAGGGAAVYFLTQGGSNGDSGVEKLLTQAESYYDDNEYDQAIETYRKVLAKDKKNETAYLEIAKAYIKNGDDQSAYDILIESLDYIDSNEILRELVKLGYDAESANGDTVSKPLFSLTAGVYYEDTYLELNAADSDIYYTLDGSKPTNESTKYGEPILLTYGITTIKAVAVKNGKSSGVAISVYEITYSVNNVPDAASVSDDEIDQYSYLGNLIGNTTGNISSGGFAAYAGGWVYFADTNNLNYLCKMKVNGSGYTLLTEESSLSISVIADWVYFVGSDSAIYRIKTDGTQKTRLNDRVCSFINVVNGKIYYSGTDAYSGEYEEYGFMYSMNLDGSGEKCLLEAHAGNMIVSGDWVYFANMDDNGYLYKIDINGGNLTLLSDEQIWYLNIAGDFIYYCTPNYNEMDELSVLVCSIKNDGSQRKLITTDGYRLFLNIFDDWMYYIIVETVTGEELTYIAKIPLYGGEEQILDISDKYIWNLNVCGSKIYYLPYSFSTGALEIAWINMDGSGRTAVDTGGQIYTPSSSNNNSSNRGSEANNITNDGIAVQDGADIYYSNAADNGYIYKLSDGVPYETPIIQHEAFYLNVYDGWLYYYNNDDNGYLYKCRTDGSMEQLLVSEVAWYISVVDGWVYYTGDYSGNFNIIKVKTDGTERTVINENESSYSIYYDGYIYYTNESDNGYIYRMDTDGSNRILLIDKPAWYLNISDGWIYFVEDDSDGNGTGPIYRARIDGSELQFLRDGLLTGINVSDGWVYFVDTSNDENRICKMNTSGNQFHSYDAVYAHSLNVVDGLIFYMNYYDFENTYVLEANGDFNYTLDAAIASGTLLGRYSNSILH